MKPSLTTVIYKGNFVQRSCYIPGIKLERYIENIKQFEFSLGTVQVHYGPYPSHPNSRPHVVSQFRVVSKRLRVNDTELIEVFLLHQAIRIPHQIIFILNCMAKCSL